jgi:hypothetical protein
MAEKPRPAQVYLTSAQVLRRYGRTSPVWLHRRQHDDSGFPPPIYIAGCRYWSLAELEAYEADEARKVAPDNTLPAIEAFKAKRSKQAA